MSQPEVKFHFIIYHFDGLIDCWLNAKLLNTENLSLKSSSKCMEMRNTHTHKHNNNGAAIVFCQHCLFLSVRKPNCHKLGIHISRLNTLQMACRDMPRHTELALFCGRVSYICNKNLWNKRTRTREICSPFLSP